MVTEHTNTVYNCGTCGEPAYFNPRHCGWFHYGSVTTCTALVPVAVRLEIPARHQPHTCTSQCDRCHTPEKCVPATRQRGELLLCTPCAGLFDLSVAVFDEVYAP